MDPSLTDSVNFVRKDFANCISVDFNFFGYEAITLLSLISYSHSQIYKSNLCNWQKISLKPSKKSLMNIKFWKSRLTSIFRFLAWQRPTLGKKLCLWLVYLNKISTELTLQILAKASLDWIKNYFKNFLKRLWHCWILQRFDQTKL